MNTKFLTLCVGMAVLGASVGTAATADGTTAEDSLVTAGNQVPYVGVKAGTEKAKNYNGDGAQADGAIAIGEDAEAQTEYSIAIGKNVNAKGGKLEGYSTYYYPAIGIGMNVKVDGRDAIAIGRGVRAEGKDALALGRDSTADGEITLAIGYNASAKLAKKPNAGSDYKQATAVGPYAKALAPSSNAFGSHSSVYEQFATALGDFASVYGVSGIAIGNQAKAGMNSTKAFASGIAIGEESKSEANQAIAIGKKAWSQATGSIALGENSETKNEYTETNALFSGVKNNDHEVGVVSVGRAKRGFTIKEVNRRITHIAGGVDDNDAVNVAQLKTISDAIGYTTDKETGKITNVGDKTVLARLAALEQSPGGSTAPGGATTSGGVHYVGFGGDENTTDANYNNDGAAGEGSIAIGRAAHSEYDGSVAIGDAAIGNGYDGDGVNHYAGTSIAIGKNAKATGGAVVIGEKASGIALGDLALGRGAKAEGTTKKTGGKNFGAAIAIGNYSKAQKVGAVALGLRTKATNKYAIAIGGDGTTEAKGEESLAIGNATKADGKNSMAIGTLAWIKGEDSIGIGHSSKADSRESVAIGRGATVKVMNSVAIGAGSYAEGRLQDTVALFSGRKQTDTKSGIVSFGYTNRERRLTNVAGGVNPTDAANIAQLQALSEQIGYTTDAATGKINNAGSKTILARLDALEQNPAPTPQPQPKLQLVAGDGIDLTEKDGKTTIGLNADTQQKIANAGPAINQQTELDVKSVKATAFSVGDKVYLDADGLHAGDRKIDKVKAGTEDTDAVNFGQLKSLDGKVAAAEKQLTDMSATVTQASRKADQALQEAMDVRDESRGGVALSTALAALKPVSFDGTNRSQIMAGIGHYQSHTAVALGVAYYANPHTMYHVGASYADGADAAVNAGVTWSFGAGGDDRVAAENASWRQMQARMDALQQENEQMKAQLQELWYLLKKEGK